MCQYCNPRQFFINTSMPSYTHTVQDFTENYLNVKTPTKRELFNSNNTRMCHAIQVKYASLTWHMPSPGDDRRQEAPAGRSLYMLASPPTVGMWRAVIGARQSIETAANRRSWRESLLTTTRMRTWRCRCPSRACCGTSAGDDLRQDSAAASGSPAGEVR